ncbi:NAD-dependent epimerase/dehydratase family protein [Mesobacterium sp. TK19101]|uniref:NAD-dependent epimerase/dehydratase family protein n=1 Tax=Mesobacterium hydrothermale TaxID=3111907 RepID=A0ABU6HH84_9RHOB|nr:NAD-dependent epimerase/dehydratase family protein [Mesobacterium sp. TK19101]MEC3861291.1 NAD-dependent epimerase/dehydratase family protein [Mesobacterium sp. TK19101]
MALQLMPGVSDQPVELIPVFRDGPVRDGAVIWQPGGNLPVGLRADVVLALWGVTPGPEKILDDNARLGSAAVRLADILGSACIIHCSSQAVYRPVSNPLSEDLHPDPQNDYGRAKLHMEQVIAAMSSASGPRSVCLRIGNVAGAESLFAAGRAGGQIRLDRFDDGQGPLRSYIAPGDLARVLATLCHVTPDSLPDVLNVAAPAPTTMEALARAMGWEVIWCDAPDTAVQRVVLDTTRLQAICPLPPQSAEAAWIARDVKAGGWDR